MSTTTGSLQWERIVELDEMIRVQGWHTGIVAECMSRWGVCRDAVYRYKRRTDQLARRHVKVEDIPTHKARQAELLDQATHAAMAKGDFASVARLVKTQAEIIGTIAPVKIDARVQHQSVVVLTTMDAETKEQRLLTADELRAERRKLTAIEADAVSVPPSVGEDNPQPDDVP